MSKQNLSLQQSLKLEFSSKAGQPSAAETFHIDHISLQPIMHPVYMTVSRI